MKLTPLRLEGTTDESGFGAETWKKCNKSQDRF